MHPKAHRPLRVVPRPSRIGAVVAVALHALAVPAALNAPDPWLSAGLLALVAVSAWATRRSWRGCAGAVGVRAFERDSSGRWWLEPCGGERLQVSVAGQPIVSRGFLVLSFGAEARRWEVALLPDSAEPEALRRLRAALRTGS